MGKQAPGRTTAGVCVTGTGCSNLRNNPKRYDGLMVKLIADLEAFEKEIAP